MRESVSSSTTVTSFQSPLWASSTLYLPPVRLRSLPTIMSVIGISGAQDRSFTKFFRRKVQLSGPGADHEPSVCFTLKRTTYGVSNFNCGKSENTLRDHWSSSITVALFQSPPVANAARYFG